MKSAGVAVHSVRGPTKQLVYRSFGNVVADPCQYVALFVLATGFNTPPNNTQPK